MNNNFFKINKLRIEQALRCFFSKEIIISTKQDHLTSEIVKKLSDFTMRRGAKRIRGMLVLLGYLSNPKNKITKNILKVAAAYEILHSYLLIHDDIIDQDRERRGKPTLHILFRKFAPPGSTLEIKKKIGEDIAIITGDLASIFSQKLLFETNYLSIQKIKSQNYLNDVLKATCSGQILDILSLPQQLLSHQKQNWRYLQKTALYTIEAPFLVGLNLGDGKINKKLFREFANYVGLAFQLADDVHNIFGSSLATRQSDIQNGKVTYLTTLSIKSNKFKQPILNILKKVKKNKGDLLKLRKLIVESGGYKLAMSKITNNFNQAEEVLEKIGLPRSIVKELYILLSNLKDKLPRVN